MQNITVVKLLGDNLSDAMEIYKYDVIAEHLTTVSPEFTEGPMFNTEGPMFNTEVSMFNTEGPMFNTEGPMMFNVSQTRNKTLPKIPAYTEPGYKWENTIPWAFLFAIVVGFVLYHRVYIPYKKKHLVRRIKLNDETEVVVERTWCDLIQASWRSSKYNPWAHRNRPVEIQSMRVLVAKAEKLEASNEAGKNEVGKNEAGKSADVMCPF